MVGLSRLWQEREALVQKKSKILERVEQLAEDPAAREVIIGKPNTSTAVKERLKIITDAIRG
jgi:hypothetical protein